MSFSLRSRHFLSQWITALLPAVPTRSRATFVELLCACLVSPEGWVTRAIGSIGRRCHWTTYYKLIERGSVRSVPLARALLTLVQSVLPLQTLNLVIDDTLALRHSPDAPGSAVRHDHANKTNRPDFVQAQCWVTLGVSVLGHGKAKLVLPILSRIVPHTGNRNKLSIALALLRVLAPVLTVPTRLLCDSWFMRAFGLAVAQSWHPGHCSGPHRYRFIFAARCDRQARSRPTAPVRAVWCEFYDDKKQTWAKPRLLLATETALSATAMVELYARRWGIEPLFHNLKRWWGISNLWQQSRTALETWMQIRSTAWTLAQLLALAVDDAFPLREVAPWRDGHPLTAGLIAQWLRIEFTGLAFRDGFDPKSQKFSFPEQRGDPRLSP